jgi:hypothetical protein
MGKENEDIKNELAKFAGKYAPAAIISAVVKTVNDNDTIVVVTGSGLEIDDARLKSVVKDGNKFILLPKIESTVLIGRIEESEEWTVLQVEEIDKVKVVINGSLFEIDGSKLLLKNATVSVDVNDAGIELKKGTDTLKQILVLLVEAVQPIVVVYGNNPNYTKLTQALTKINNLLR